MDKNEKIYLIQCLLEDVRGNWADPIEPRVGKAKELCEELGGEFDILAGKCGWFLENFDGWIDGRYFRTEFPYGYNGMDALHNCPHTLNDKSREFREYANELITYPEYRFNDVEY